MGTNTNKKESIIETLGYYECLTCKKNTKHRKEKALASTRYKERAIPFVYKCSFDIKTSSVWAWKCLECGRSEEIDLGG